MEEKTMVKTQEEDLELENLKFSHKKEELLLKEELAQKEHIRKIERLNLQLEIAKATGKIMIEADENGSE